MAETRIPAPPATVFVLPTVNKLHPEPPIALIHSIERKGMVEAG
jgi:hypothetical protein